MIWPGIWFDAAGLEPVPKVIALNLFCCGSCGSCVDLNNDDGELYVTSLQWVLIFKFGSVRNLFYSRWNNRPHLRIGTRLVVLNICKLGILLLAELKNMDGTFGVDIAMPPKNFN